MLLLTITVYILGSILAYGLLRYCFQKKIVEWTATESKATPAVLLLSWSLVLFLLLWLLEERWSR